MDSNPDGFSQKFSKWNLGVSAPNKIYLKGTFNHVQIGLENMSEITNQNDSRQDEQQSIRDDIKDLKDRVGDLETELNRVKKKNTELENDAADLRSKIDHLTKVVKTLKETSNETKEMTGGKRKGPILHSGYVKKQYREVGNDEANLRNEIEPFADMAK